MPPSATTISGTSPVRMVKAKGGPLKQLQNDRIPQQTDVKRPASLSWQDLTSKYDPTLLFLYVATTYLCFVMVGWILLSPASWLLDKSKFHRETLLPYFESMGFFRVTPTVIVTKYQHHPAIHLTHLLPGALWAAIIPFQLHPTWRTQHRKLHRISGYIFLACALLMSLGIGIILQRQKTFVHSFPQLTPVEGGFKPHLFLLFIPLQTLWFAMTLLEAIRQARHHKYSVHQRWIIRHVASGIWVAAQRFVAIPIYTGFFHVTNASYRQGNDLPSLLQRQTFSDSGILSAALCVCAGEYAISRISRLKRSQRTS